MALYKALNPDVMVNGQTVLAIANGMGVMRRMGLDILAQNRIVDPRPEGWYPQQDWLDAFRQIAERVGPHTLHAIGKSIPENAEFPPHIDDIHKALASIDVAYHMNHSLYGEPLFDPASGQLREGIGHYHYRRLGDREAELVCDNPYPCGFDKGIIEAMGRRFKPEDAFFVSVAHDTTQGCREHGAESCTYRVTW